MMSSLAAFSAHARFQGRSPTVLLETISFRFACRTLRRLNPSSDGDTPFRLSRNQIASLELLQGKTFEGRKNNRTSGGQSPASRILIAAHTYGKRLYWKDDAQR